MATQEAINQITRILLKYLDKKTSLKLMRELYGKVQGNQAVTNVFKRVVDKLLEDE